MEVRKGVLQRLLWVVAKLIILPIHRVLEQEGHLNQADLSTPSWEPGAEWQNLQSGAAEIRLMTAFIRDSQQTNTSGNPSL